MSDVSPPATGALTTHPEIRPAENADDLRAVHSLIETYARWLADDHGIGLAFQGIDDELAGLPGKYAPPEGALFLAGGPAEPLGCVALRPHAPGTCEIKRLFVSPAGRGQRLGRRLAEAILAEARRLGYTRALLDTAPFMAEAGALYRDLGFREIPPYYDNPIPGVRYMACDLRSEA